VERQRRRTYFFQNENPYDPPTQSAWMNGGTNGYAAYEVAPSVTTHQAWGVGSYCFFNVNNAIINDHAFEAPNTAGVQFHDYSQCHWAASARSATLSTRWARP